MEKISVVVSCYNEEESIPLFYNEIKKVMSIMKEFQFEVLFVDDGSKDRTLEVAKELAKKEEPKIRSFFARRFYHLIKKISDTEIVDGARDYRLMTRQFVNSLLELEEYNRFSKGLYGWVGYKTKWMEYENIERVAGETKWSFWKLFVYAIEGIVAFSTVPLLISAIMGIVLCVLAFILIIVIVAKTLIFGDPTSGWPSMVCIMLFIGGIQLFCIGILGEYFAKAYMELKKRPIFICKETNIQP